MTWLGKEEISIPSFKQVCIPMLDASNTRRTRTMQADHWEKALNYKAFLQKTGFVTFHTPYPCPFTRFENLGESILLILQANVVRPWRAVGPQPLLEVTCKDKA